MHLLYVDESYCKTHTKNYLILAGICIFERQIHWLEEPLNEIAARFDKDNPRNIEFHGNPMFHGGGYWRQVEDPSIRIQTIKDVLTTFADSHKTNRLFGMQKEIDPNESEELNLQEIFIQIASRFDNYLQRQYIQTGNKEKGIIIFDKSTHERTIQNWTTTYKEEGHEWGKLKNFVEVPMFLDSKASRMIQLADLVAYAMNRNLRGDNQFYQIIEPRFDKDQTGKNHGLRTY